MSRSSADQTRQLLLDTAVQVLHERGPTAGVLHVRLSDVVTRAGLTTGAAYRLWADQQDFHDALAVEAMRWRDRSMLARTTKAAFSVVAGGGELDKLLRAAGAANVQTLPTDNGIMTTLALRAAAYNQPSLLHASSERSQDMTASFTQLYLELLRTYQLQMRAPFHPAAPVRRHVRPRRRLRRTDRLRRSPPRHRHRRNAVDAARRLPHSVSPPHDRTRATGHRR